MLRYTLSMPAPHTHYLHVELRVETAGADALDFVMPVWTPGAYEVHDYAGKVHAVSAVDGAGRALPCSKATKHTWRIITKGAKVVTLCYQVYTFEIEVDKSYLDADRCTINGAGVFMYVEGRKAEAVTLTLCPPKTWTTVNTGLVRARGAGYVFLAADYDELVDCPIMMGNHAVRHFKVRGVPHTMVFAGPGNYDQAAILKDTAKTVEAAADVFGEIPYSHYTFFMDNVHEGGGGLEHKNSTHMIFPRFKWKPRKDYLAAMGLVSHEFFHTWNVKRLRPHPLGPFDYTREVHTPLLWFAEGFTSYYDEILLRRAGVITPREYLNELAREIRRLNLTPGRNLQSLEESSFDTWIKFYRQHSDSHNTTISYYNKGAVFGWILDMEIRRLTKGKRTLDHVMRLLYQRFYKDQDVGITTPDIEDACREVAGRSLKPLFDEVVRGRGEIDYDRHLAHVGLEISEKSCGNDSNDEETADGKPVRPAYLGLRTRADGGATFVSQLLAEGPAYQAGVSVRDEILALNGFRVNGDGLEKRLGELAPGATAQLLVSRAGIVRDIPVQVAARPPVEFAIQPKKTATAEQKKLCKQWLGADWSSIDRPKSGPDFRPREKVI